ncbi:hypothetical protein CPB83DRAFT_938112 [Crepidotus variabilis]|uniref:Uncharacterized protein n=1 Tax=Crepidotus variabilis TaxID=179855 RepID=A0A9P6JNE0_9AGAR|nr:hypothetical protein CPB83DRAFT_938112 [Crepidotus variabilis]
MAKLSWIIAIALASDKENVSTDYPQWMKHLLDSQADPLLVDSIRHSAAAFSKHEPFVDVFVDILESCPTHPSIQFLVQNKVPVWYRWKGAEESEASASPYLCRFAPFTEQNPTFSPTHDIPLPPRPDYSDALPRIKDTPPSMPSGSGTSVAPRAGPSSDQSTLNKPWVALFADQDAKRLQLLALKTPKEMQAYRDRQLNPSCTRTTIWEWDIVDEAELTSPQSPLFFSPQILALPATVPAFLLSTASIAPSSKSIHIPPPAPSSLSTALDPVETSTWVPNPETGLQDAETAFDWDPRHITDDLFKYYSFLLPQPVSLTVSMAAPITQSDCLTVASVVGHRELAPRFETGVVMQLCKQFVLEITTPVSAPPSQFHNIASGPRCVSHSLRFQYLRKMSPTPFSLIYLELSNPTVPWRITITNAMDALLLRWLNPTLNEVQIVSILVQRGIKFHTFLNIPCKKHYPPPSPCISIRMVLAPPTHRDYLAYVEERNAMFLNPRIRSAALKAGGILWRLAMSTVNYLEVLDGPLSVLMLRSIGEFLPGRRSDRLWCDDGISNAEEDILCGTVHKYSGGNCIILYWWPTDTIWQLCIAYTHWTEITGHFFNGQAAELKQENAQPLSTSQWRHRIRNHVSARKAKRETMKFAEDLLGAYLRL